MLAAAGQFRTDSLCCAFEEAIQAKAEQGGELTAPEGVVLAVEAIEREVNNGGYDQFFRNSSLEFAAVAVDTLTRIGCPEKAALGLDEVTPAAVGAVMALENPARDEKLELCDQRYFAGSECIEDRLFAYIEANAGQFAF